MGSRTFLPTIIALAKRICVYITRYGVTMEKFLATEEQKTALRNMNTACAIFVELVQEEVNP